MKTSGLRRRITCRISQLLETPRESNVICGFSPVVSVLVRLLGRFWGWIGAEGARNSIVIVEFSDFLGDWRRFQMGIGGKAGVLFFFSFSLLDSFSSVCPSSPLSLSPKHVLKQSYHVSRALTMVNGLTTPCG